MPSVPQWLLGRHLTAVTLVPQSIANDGTLTDASPVALTVRTQSIEFESEVLGEDIRPVNSAIANFVGHTDDSTLTLEILLSTGTGSNPIATAMATYDYFKISFTRGGSTFTGYFYRRALRDGVQSLGKNVAVAVFRQVDVGDLPMSPAASATDVGYFPG